MVIPGSSFYKNMMGLSPQCYIPIFVEIDPSVLEKTFEGFLTYIGVAARWSCDQNIANTFSMPLPKEAPHKILT